MLLVHQEGFRYDPLKAQSLTPSHPTWLQTIFILDK